MGFLNAPEKVEAPEVKEVDAKPETKEVTPIDGAIEKLKSVFVEQTYKPLNPVEKHFDTQDEKTEFVQKYFNEKGIKDDTMITKEVRKIEKMLGYTGEPNIERVYRYLKLKRQATSLITKLEKLKNG